MAKQTNIQFKVDLAVDGQKKVADLGMSLGDLENVMKAVDKAAEKTRGATAATIASIEYAINAVNRINSAFSELSKAYSIQQEAETKLANNMRNTMDATEGQIQAIKDLCSAQQDLGVVGDEVQLAGAQELATYLSTTDALKKLIPVMNDMIVQQNGLGASGESAATIATMLGKVMDGQTGALKRYGYSFDEAQEKILKTGTEMERAAVLAEVVGASIGGMNEAMRKTASGEMQAALNTLGDWKEDLGKLVISMQPVITTIANLGMAYTSFTQLAKAISLSTVAMKTFSFISSKVTGPIISAKAQIAALTATTTGATRAIQIAGVALKAAFGPVAIVSGIIAIGAALLKLREQSEDTSASLDKIRESNESIAESIGRARAEMDSEITNLRRLIDAKADTTKAVNDLNAKYGDELGHQKDAAAWLEILTTKSQAYATAKALEAESIRLASEEYALSEKQRQNLESQKKLKDEGKDVTHSIAGSTNMGASGPAMGGGDLIITEHTSEAMQKLLDEEKENNKQLADIAEQRERVAERLAAVDLSTVLETNVGGTGTGNTPTVKAEVEVEYQEGSLGALEKQLSDLKGKLKFAVDDTSRADLYREIQSVESQIHYIQWRMETPTESLGKMVKQTAADYAKALSKVNIPELLPENFQYKGPMPDIKDNSEVYKGIASGVDALTSSLSAFSQVTNESAGAWLAWSASTISAITKALPQIVALVSAEQGKAMAQAMGQNVSLGPFGWIAGIAAMASVAAAFASIPKFADGGIAYGPTLGLFGEYPGASNNPEVVAPLSDLESMLNPSDGLSGEVVFRIKGREIVGILEKEARYSSKR